MSSSPHGSVVVQSGGGGGEAHSALAAFPFFIFSIMVAIWFSPEIDFALWHLHFHLLGVGLELPLWGSAALLPG